MPELRGDGALVFNRRVVHPNLKHCINCVNHQECYGQGHNPMFPSGWRLKENWDPIDLEPYMQEIIAGICNRYLPSRADLAIQWTRTREALRQSGEWNELSKEWDS